MTDIGMTDAPLDTCFICQNRYRKDQTDEDDISFIEYPITLSCGHTLGSWYLYNWMVFERGGDCLCCRATTVGAGLGKHTTTSPTATTNLTVAIYGIRLKDRSCDHHYQLLDQKLGHLVYKGVTYNPPDGHKSWIYANSSTDTLCVSAEVTPTATPT
jgi:hypothetical protein